MTPEELKNCDSRIANTNDAGYMRYVYQDVRKHIDQQAAELARLQEWRDSVSNAIKTLPEFAAGEWGGDKEGWGYHFEVVRWMVKELARLREENERLRSEVDADADQILAMGGDHWVSEETKRLVAEKRQLREENERFIKYYDELKVAWVKNGNIIASARRQVGKLTGRCDRGYLKYPVQRVLVELEQIAKTLDAVEDGT